MSYQIEIINLTKHFTPNKGLTDCFIYPFKKKKAIKAVDNVNIKIKKGEIVGLIGPNGAGKTTLLKMLATSILPTKGTAFINGYSIVKEQQQVKKRTVLLSGEERSFYWRLTGRQNLEFFAALYSLSPQQIKIKIKYLLSFLELEEKADMMFKDYSAGTKQKITVARSLLNDPQVLLMDEPTKNLDPLAAKTIKTFFRKELARNQRKTILFSTHHLDEALELCDQIIIMAEGRIKGFGSLKELQKNFASGENSLKNIFDKLALKKQLS